MFKEHKNEIIGASIMVVALVAAIFIIKSGGLGDVSSLVIKKSVPNPTPSISISPISSMSPEAQKTNVLNSLKIVLSEVQTESTLKTIPNDLSFVLEGADNSMLKSATYVGGKMGYHLELDFDLPLADVYLAYNTLFIKSGWARLSGGRMDNFAVLLENKNPYQATALFYDPSGNKTHVIIYVVNNGK